MESFALGAGDILLYSSSGSLEDKIIELFTHGPYVHCAVAINENTMIESVGTHGVIKSAIRKPNFVIPINPTIPSTNIERAIAFITRRIGDGYGYLDILLDGVKVFLPRRFSNTPILIAPSEFSCSHLAVLFLLVLGVQIPDSFVLNPASISPNDICRWSLSH